MTPHRDPLAAALARAEAAEAALARRPVARMEWRVVHHGHDAFPSVLVCPMLVLMREDGPLAMRCAFAALVMAALAGAWALAFVRRVPVDGGGR